MSWLELFLLALSLCIDTFAVSVSGSQSIRKSSFLRILGISMVFAVFQGGLTLAGWLGGVSLHRLITSVDHWIAFALLSYIGIKMIAEGIGNIRKSKCGQETECSVNLLSGKTLVMSAIATSIDAMAVGITLAVVELPLSKLCGGMAMIAVVTAAASLAGVFSGRWLGKCFGDRAQIAGGAVLAAIGVKILLEHTILG